MTSIDIETECACGKTISGEVITRHVFGRQKLELVMVVEKCPDCAAEAETEGKDSRDNEIAELKERVSELESQVQAWEDTQ
jgi:hypothetical protein